jgi:tricorn protease
MNLILRTFIAFASLIAWAASAIDISNTRLVSDPAPGTTGIAFAYANDLWIAALDGSSVRRLTVHPGMESGPRVSPDGRMVAFTGRYEGNTDVYVVPFAGGVPQRLTWHPGGDIALGFTPDGKSVLFSSPREVYTGRYTQLFTVPVSGGYPTKLPIPNASKAAIAPDGRTIAYVPLQESFGQWKHYRGGTASRILLFDIATQEAKQVPQPAGRCNDTDPMWVGNVLYFRSDRDGEFNVYAFDQRGEAVRRLTQHVDFPVVQAAAGGGKIAYEQGGFVHLLDPARKKSQQLKLGVAADLVERRPRWVKGAKWIRSASLSPSGARAAFEFRGEVLTVPREKGDDRNLTLTPAAHERSPAWSPDGKWIALFSDEGGAYALHLVAQDAKSARRTFALQGAGFYAEPRWSPDSQKISYTDNALTIWILHVESGRQT